MPLSRATFPANGWRMMGKKMTIMRAKAVFEMYGEERASAYRSRMNWVPNAQTRQELRAALDAIRASKRWAGEILNRAGLELFESVETQKEEEEKLANLNFARKVTVSFTSDQYERAIQNDDGLAVLEELGIDYRQVAEPLENLQLRLAEAYRDREHGVITITYEIKPDVEA